MAQLSNFFVALPGGIGTLEEVIEIFTWLQLGLHLKPVGLLNVGGFYDALLQLLDHMRDEHFSRLLIVRCSPSNETPNHCSTASPRSSTAYPEACPWDYPMVKSAEFQMKNPNRLSHRVEVGYDCVPTSDDHLGLRSGEMTTPIRDHPIRSGLLRAMMTLPNHTVIRNLDRQFGKGDQGWIFRESVRTAENWPRR